jgi:hypothetical protein
MSFPNRQQSASLVQWGSIKKSTIALRAVGVKNAQQGSIRITRLKQVALSALVGFTVLNRA